MAVHEGKPAKNEVLASPKNSEEIPEETIKLLDSLCSDSSYLSYFNEFLTRFEPKPEDRLRDSKKFDFK